MLGRVYSFALVGLNGHRVVVEAHVVPGAPSFAVVGLPDAAVQESRERVRAAIVNAGFQFPPRRITVNLAPASLRKVGPVYDLPVALAILQATGQLSGSGAAVAAVGELGLDACVRPVTGVLAVAECARRRGNVSLVLPAANAPEAALVSGLRVVPVQTLAEAAAALQDPDPPLARAVDAAALLDGDPPGGADMADVAGQAQARRALEVAAAGGHNLLMVGPPGSGKTMLARRLPTILPPLSVPEAFEITRIVSVAGLLPANEALVRRRPFRSPHHSISTPGLIGGGGTPRPGEASLAHLGVLFLDEFPEFRTSALEALRQPLEDGEVTISRALSSLTFPARFMLVAAMNPCPCGHRGDPGRECSCLLSALHRYRSRLSGPLLDRIDMRIDVPRLEPGVWRMAGAAESSEQIRARVCPARERQRRRLRGETVYANAHLGSRQLRRLCRLAPDAADLLDHAYVRLHLTARACDRIVKVAQTIADLEAARRIEHAHVAEALAYRDTTVQALSERGRSSSTALS